MEVELVNFLIAKVYLALYIEQTIFEDVKAALNLWLKWTSDFAIPDSTLILVYYILDVLQLKVCLPSIILALLLLLMIDRDNFWIIMEYVQGFMELFDDAYQLVINMYKMKNVSTDKWLPLLWQSRRLNHALCWSEINEEVIKKVLDQFDELSDVGSWAKYFQESQSLMMGFNQKFSLLYAEFDYNIDDIRRVLDELSKVRSF